MSSSTTEFASTHDQHQNKLDLLIADPTLHRGLLMFRWQLQLNNTSDTTREELMMEVLEDEEVISPKPPTTLGMALGHWLNEYLKEYLEIYEVTGIKIGPLVWEEMLREKGLEFDTEETEKVLAEITKEVLGGAGIEVVMR